MSNMENEVKTLAEASAKAISTALNELHGIRESMFNEFSEFVKSKFQPQRIEVSQLDNQDIPSSTSRINAAAKDVASAVSDFVSNQPIIQQGGEIDNEFSDNEFSDEQGP
jgi:hypothetical protein